jgi:glycosyltransferase involved in cell wall biosynthesis
MIKLVNKKFILFLPKWYPDIRGDQNGNFIRRHAEAVALFNNVAVIYVKGYSDDDCPDFYIDKNTTNKVLTYRVIFRKYSPTFSLINRFINVFLYYSAYFRALKTLRNEVRMPDLVHVHVLFQPGIIAYLIKLFYKIPYIISEQWTGYGNKDNTYAGFSFLRKWAYRFIARNASCATAISNDLRNNMLKFNLLNQYYIVPNVVDTSVFKVSSSPETKSKIRLIHISSLNDKQKNVSGILRTIKKISQERNDFELYILGQPNDEIFRYAEENSLLNRYVFYLGYKFNGDLAQVIQSADFFVLFSNYETFGCVVAESLACGIPVVATRVDGVREIVNVKNGILVEPGNEEDLRQAILYMMDNFQHYDSIHLHNEANSKYSYEVVGKELANIYLKFAK